MINKIYKIIHNKYSRFLKFFFFLRYVFAIFLISIFFFLLIPKFFDYENKQDIIKEYFEKKNISGELIQDEWVDFGYNRTLNIQAAYNKTDYIILMDADLVINIIDKNFKSLMSDNTNQAYLIKWYELITYRFKFDIIMIKMDVAITIFLITVQLKLEIF